MLYQGNKEFETALTLEIKREKRIKENAEKALRTMPKGSLNVKKRKSGNSFYQVFSDKVGDKVYRKEVNITGNWDLIWALFEKRIQKTILKRTTRNLSCLKKTQKEYKTLNLENVVEEHANSYGEVFWQNRRGGLRNRIHEDFEKAPFDPKSHTKETDCGILVRSKSEQLLANALFAYGIPFHYEERYKYEKGDIGKIYPDFTILLPNGKTIIWEHLGMLDKPSYCSRTANKLNIFQLNGLILNKNLIITMDDSNQNFGSDVINDVIQKYILPYFEGVNLQEIKQI